MHEASGRQWRRLADDLRRQEDWVPHWHIYGDLNHQPWSYERKEGRRGHESGLLHRELSLCDADVVLHQARLHDFSRWIQGVFRDSALATTVEAIEGEAATMWREQQRDPQRIVERNRSEAPGLGETLWPRREPSASALGGCPPTQAFGGPPNGPGIVEPIR
jgi:hypothetical protein